MSLSNKHETYHLLHLLMNENCYSMQHLMVLLKTQGIAREASKFVYMHFDHQTGRKLMNFIFKQLDNTNEHFLY